MPDFKEGGGRYTQALRSFKRQSRVNRKIPASTPMFEYVESLQGDLGTRDGDQHIYPPRPIALCLFCADVIGFFYLLRAGELEALKWGDVELLIDLCANIVLRVELPR